MLPLLELTLTRTGSWPCNMESPASPGCSSGTGKRGSSMFSLLFRNLPDCPRRYHYEDGMEVGNIISWVGNQMEEAHRLEPAPPVFTPRPPYQPRPNHNPPPPIPNETPSTTTSTEKPDERTCNRQCSRIFSQVCGSNGRTYNNRCLLELDACERATSIQVLREGSCLSTTTEESQPTTTDPYPQQTPTTPENTFGIVVCRRTEFTCSLDQKCISYIQRCDGKQDCSDGQAKEFILYLVALICCQQCRSADSAFPFVLS